MTGGKLDRRFPSIAAMERVARKRVPRFALDYLQGGIGSEFCLRANRAALDDVALVPRYLLENQPKPQLATELFGKSYDAPFAPSPVGLTGLIWPRAPELISRAARRHGLPSGLSSFASSSIEDVAAIAGDYLWFQLYCTNVPEIENDLIDRAAAAGCGSLIVTIDIPTHTRRERDIANGLSVPPRFDPATLLQIAARPAWALRSLQAGIPQFRSMQKYIPKGARIAESARFLSEVIEGHVTTGKLERIRKRWKGTLIVKGVLSRADARTSLDIGADALVVSNHGGRQLDAAQTAPEILPAIRDTVGRDFPLLADGGVRSGLDIARLIACGADFVLLGRAMAYAVGAAGEAGVDHAISILKQELRQSMAQLGCSGLRELRDRRP